MVFNRSKWIIFHLSMVCIFGHGKHMSDKTKANYVSSESKDMRGNQILDMASDIFCDVIIVGGSSAALGAALASANSSEYVTCLLEPTDWLGGQLTTAAVSAVDFGPYNKNWWYQSRRFQSMMERVGPGDPGRCWVSDKCFLPGILFYEWILPAVKSLPNLQIFYNTVPKFVTSDKRFIKSVAAIQRIPKQHPYPWNLTLSEMIEDSYSSYASPFFDKKILQFKGKMGDPVVIEATEFGEILVLSNATYRSGVEAPKEDSSSTIETCGQCITDPFYVGSSQGKAPKQNVPNPGGQFGMGYFNWTQIWTYRRSLAVGNSTEESIELGDISNQNWGSGNDYCKENLFLTHDESANQTSDWIGGIKINVLAAAEQRAYGWYHYYRGKASQKVQPHLFLHYGALETQTGLPKIPYIRDSRRSIGIRGFRLMKTDLDKPAASSNFEDLETIPIHKDSPPTPPKYATRFNDSIALGNYIYADVHGTAGCSWPPYIRNNSILPYHIPFRALTNVDFDNLLVAGKSMAQTFHAQSATRMHPSEFMTGESAGTAAAVMLKMKWTTTQMYEHVSLLQDELCKFMPIFWDKPRTIN